MILCAPSTCSPTLPDDFDAVRGRARVITVGSLDIPVASIAELIREPGATGP